MKIIMIGTSGKFSVINYSSIYNNVFNNIQCIIYLQIYLCVLVWVKTNNLFCIELI